MKLIDALSAVQVRQAKLPAGKKQIKLADGKGMYLLINQTGKYWRLDYRFNDKRKTLALGVYPVVSLSNARELRDDKRKMIRNGIDPAAQRQATKQAKSDSFEAIAREWFAKEKTIWKPGHAETVIGRLENNIFPWLPWYGFHNSA